MSNNLFFLASRLQYLKENTKKYYRSCISLRVYSLSERIFYQFPITNIFNNYRKLIALGEHVFIPELYRETKTDDKGEGFSAKLWSIDLTGYNERLVTTETDASDPSWSSLLSN